MSTVPAVVPKIGRSTIVRKHFTPGVALGIVAIVLATSGSAVAGSLITSSQIKDGTIQNKDIKKGTIAARPPHSGHAEGDQARRRRPARRARPAPPAPRAPPARPARRALDGRPGTTVQASPGVAPTAGNWGVINRNTDRLAGRVPALRPAHAAARQGLAEPHRQGRHREGRLRQRGRHGRRRPVRQRHAGRLQRLHDGREQRARAPANMPSITFEVDPNVNGKASNYTSLVFMPANTAGQPVERLHRRAPRPASGAARAARSPAPSATSTARAARSTSCRRTSTTATTTRPKILSVAVVKGKDNSWSGAVDGLRINDTVFDFEETGVFTTTS